MEEFDDVDWNFVIRKYLCFKIFKILDQNNIKENIELKSKVFHLNLI